MHTRTIERDTDDRDSTPTKRGDAYGQQPSAIEPADGVIVPDRCEALCTVPLSDARKRCSSATVDAGYTVE